MLELRAATSRHAQAQGRIELSQAAFAAIRDKANPKGDVLALAEVAGLMSAKRTSDCLPLCHPLAIEKIGVSFALCPETSNQLPSVFGLLRRPCYRKDRSRNGSVKWRQRSAPLHL